MSTGSLQTQDSGLLGFAWKPSRRPTLWSSSLKSVTYASCGFAAFQESRRFMRMNESTTHGPFTSSTQHSLLPLIKSSTYNHLLHRFISNIMHLPSVLSKYKLKTFRGNVSDDDAIELTDMGSFHAPNPTSGPSPSEDDGEGACSQSGKRRHATNRDREHP